MYDEQNDNLRSFLEPLRIKPSEVFVQNVMRKVRNYAERDEWVLWPRFVRWALPALALSVTSFTLAMAYALAPATSASADSLLQEGHAETLSNWISNPPTEDQILETVVQKP